MTQNDSTTKREAKRASDRAYYYANRDRILAYQKAYQTAHHEKYTAYLRSYYAKNKLRFLEKHRAASRKWRQDNPAHKLALTQQRRAKLSGALKGVRTAPTPEDIAHIRSLPCIMCGAPPPSSIDHILPVSKGGKHDLRNLQPLCGICNSSKHTATLGPLEAWGERNH